MRLAAAALLLACRAPSAAQTHVLGPARDVSVLEDFDKSAGSRWVARFGSNVTARTTFGHALPGIATTLVLATPRIVDPADREASHNWYALKRSGALPADLPNEFDGFRLVIGSGGQKQWWLSMTVVGADGKRYSRLVFDAILPSGRLIECLLPLDTFMAGSDILTAETVRSAREIEYAFSVPGADIYLDRIAVYRRARMTGWLDFATSHPNNNLFERGEKVEMRFTVGGDPPSAAHGFRWEIRDLAGRIALAGHRALNGARSHSIPAPVARHGYYEVRAWWTDRAGKSIGTESCIRGEGTVPEGIGTFAVLPSTVNENKRALLKLGRAAFFGLHGDFHGLADRIGLAWRFGYEKWPWLEPARPDRLSGIAEWAARRLSEPPAPLHTQHILPFRGNMAEEVPLWARGPDGVAPPFADWDDYLAMVRDAVKVEKHRYPHMKPRIYGCAWEANLNMPPYNATLPPHTPEQLAELFRRSRAAIRAEDPTGLVIGPCPSVMDTAWFETMFKAGLLDHVDAIETHGYSEGAWDPEENDYPGKLARLRSLMLRYGGKTLDVYCTELGQPGILGATIVHRSQAERMVRTSVILKGEGVRVFMPFYGIDFDRVGYWGFLFNLDVDAPEGPWAARRVTPKPMVTAMAACARMLEGTRPVRRLRSLGEGVWAYVFADRDRRITVAWTPGKPRMVRVPVVDSGAKAGVVHAASGVDARRLKSRLRTAPSPPSRTGGVSGMAIAVYDIEGHRMAVETSGREVRVRVGPSPIYIVEGRASATAHHPIGSKKR